MIYYPLCNVNARMILIELGVTEMYTLIQLERKQKNILNVLYIINSVYVFTDLKKIIQYQQT